ncbi:hypothetical protein BGW36DRAFT_32123 [Talaromyces proteolyticus]|uniref:Uncharacterized protein n=1 Tax=Talaromyces proteolyticus TaxID=1131652 RepID=A0AAD4PXD4_9EURO|nr:uncharacterized protein BGW36DRAFT_32123 [Talaromyces proteolyticus]KAH8693016.1 hypothetical protein BGW36DRAFT_32123 [Talaromyces proteolyticus]
MGTPLQRSPKRKRDAAEKDHYSPPSSPTSSISVASLQEARLIEAEDIGRHSPRTVVASRMKELAIRESSLNLDMNRSNLTARIQQSAPNEGQDTSTETVEQPLSSSIEEVDREYDVSSKEVDEQKVEDLPTQATCQLERVPSRKKVKPVPASSRTRKKASSPPVENVPLNPLTWSDCEITGHSPTDPTDDGYGINGIGFKPTPAIAWARSQQRQKQVAEWKHREDREAREKRRERREGMVPDASNETAGAAQKKVKFNLS